MMPGAVIEHCGGLRATWAGVSDGPRPSVGVHYLVDRGQAEAGGSLPVEKRATPRGRPKAFHDLDGEFLEPVLTLSSMTSGEISRPILHTLSRSYTENGTCNHGR